MRVRFTPYAKRELFRVHDYYEGKTRGLGDAFLDEVEQVLKAISMYPRSWTSTEDGFRRWPLDRFPYGILYRVRDDEIVISVVGHLKRKASFWKRAGRKK